MPLDGVPLSGGRPRKRIVTKAASGPAASAPVGPGKVTNPIPQRRLSGLAWLGLSGLEKVLWADTGRCDPALGASPKTVCQMPISI